MNTIIEIALYLLNVVSFLIVVQAILSWLIAFNVINTHNRTVAAIADGLDRLFDPLYRPVRRAMARMRIDTGALDLSPLVVLVLIQVLMMIIGSLRGYNLPYQ